VVARGDAARDGEGPAMTARPLVSIIIPVFNGSNYVGAAIESALAQDYPDFEVIVVDDGSTDEGATSAVVRQFEPHVRYIQKPNGGVATALNAGISAMRGELFSWLSHDDMYKPAKVRRQVEVFLNFGRRCVVIGDFELMNERGEYIDWTSLAGRNLVGRPLDAVFQSLINGCALLVPKSLFAEAGRFEPGLPTTQDYHLWWRIARLSPFVHCPHADVRQRVHPLQGSRHASHLDEASRMFIHLIDATPFEVMRAYDGSPLRFLMKVRERLNGYAGLQAYLDFRIDELLRQFRYSVVLWPAGKTIEPAPQKTLRQRKHAPAGIVLAGPQGRDDIASLCDQAEAVCRETSSEAVIFLEADQLLTEASVSAGLCRLIDTDADLVRPSQPPAVGPAVAKLIVRRGALRSLAETFAAGGPGWPAIPAHIQLTEYSTTAPAAAPFNLTKALLSRRAAGLAGKVLGRAFRQAQRGMSLVSNSARMLLPAERASQALRRGHQLSYAWTLSENSVASALKATQNPQLPTLFFLSHRLGGGAHRHLVELVLTLAGKVNCICGFGGADGTLHLCSGLTPGEGGVVFNLSRHLDALVRILRRAGVTRADVHHTKGFDEGARKLLDALGLPYDVTMVDYHFVANDPHLCLPESGFVGDSRLESGDSGMLRPAPLPVLAKAERVITLCRDMSARLQRLYPNLRLITAQHWRESSATRVRHVFVPRFWENEPLRVVVVGRIAEAKGRSLILEAARLVSQRSLPIRFHVLGRMDIPAGRDASPGVLTVHGRFDSAAFSQRLGAIAPHLAWLPTQAPETWSYVLTDLMESALPLVASAIGAIPERCYGRPATWQVPWDSDAEAWVELFLRLRATELREPPLWLPTKSLPKAESFYFDRYLRPAKDKQAWQGPSRAGQSTEREPALYT
jgi:glycosyltransferase involved in cell wall biosynthesis